MSEHPTMEANSSNAVNVENGYRSLTTQAPGNTIQELAKALASAHKSALADEEDVVKPTKTIKCRAYQFTINELEKYEPIKKYVMGLKAFRYILACLEIAPTTGKEHIHIYVYFNVPVALSKKKLLKVHVEFCRGSPQSNIAYLKKGGKILIEHGDTPNQGAATVNDLKQVANPGELDWRQLNTWTKIHSDMEADMDIDDWHKEVKVYYIQGPSGIGKSEKAKQLIRDNKQKYGGKFNRVKCEGNFWLGVGNEAKVAVYDDFRDSHMKASEFVNFIDYNKQLMNVKGGQKTNKYELIIITSVQRLEEIYKNMTDEPRKQWERRVEVINMYPDIVISEEVIEELSNPLEEFTKPKDGKEEIDLNGIVIRPFL